MKKYILLVTLLGLATASQPAHAGLGTAARTTLKVGLGLFGTLAVTVGVFDAIHNLMAKRSFTGQQSSEERALMNKEGFKAGITGVVGIGVAYGCYRLANLM